MSPILSYEAQIGVEPRVAFLVDMGTWNPNYMEAQHLHTKSGPNSFSFRLILEVPWKHI